MEITNWTHPLKDIAQTIKTTFGSLSTDQLNWKPNSETWSIGQNIDHLIVINSTYFPVFKALQGGNYKTPFVGKIRPLVRFFGNMVLNGVQPDAPKKIKTFPIWEPSHSAVPGDIVDQFQNHQNALISQIVAAQPFLAPPIVIASPASSFIVYTLPTAFDIIVAHERRHLLQAKKILGMM